MIIAIFGYKGSGKSTVARYFEQQGFRRRPIAAPLKQMLKSGGLTDTQLYGEEKEKPLVLLGGKTPRYAMQTLGDWGRSIDKDYWVRLWLNGLVADLDLEQDVVVDDLRFPHEADHLLGLGAYFIKVERPGFEVPPQGRHESEAYAEALPFDVRITNDGTVDDLLEQVESKFGLLEVFDRMILVVDQQGRDRTERFRVALDAIGSHVLQTR